MEETIRAIVEKLRCGDVPDSRWLDRLLRDANRKNHDSTRHIAKKRLVPFYLKERNSKSEVFKSWGITEEIDDAIVALLRAKPRRTASGVATVTVLTKPWPCSGDCVYCPSDIRMPKSYLSDEPACQRAERCGFDPYKQVIARLRVLADMGHNIDKVELIVLGGTWSEYPEGYQRWFIKELFRALNDFNANVISCAADCSGVISNERSEPTNDKLEVQAQINSGEISYNQAVKEIYGDGSPECLWEELEFEHKRNETSTHRNVGLVVETRPDRVTNDHLRDLRRLGCTKIQLGIQSLTPEVLSANSRTASLESIEKAMALLREFGFKSHIHFMVNLLGSAPEKDISDFDLLVSDPRFMPDEIKLYPCALVESARLTDEHDAGRWHPYNEEELVGLLARCVLATPAQTRISRMIRDISSTDIIAGNKKTNLRQLVELRLGQSGRPVREIRLREIGTDDVDLEALHLDVDEYDTSNTREFFLQYVNDSYRLAAFLRLSLPKDPDAAAMIREVHVYGRVSKLHDQKEGAQHTGLGRNMIQEACLIALHRGYDTIKVISAVGTKEYYRSLGFCDDGLYQSKGLLQ